MLLSNPVFDIPTRRSSSLPFGTHLACTYQFIGLSDFWSTQQHMTLTIFCIIITVLVSYITAIGPASGKSRYQVHICQTCLDHPTKYAEICEDTAPNLITPSQNSDYDTRSLVRPYPTLFFLDGDWYLSSRSYWEHRVCPAWRDPRSERFRGVQSAGRTPP